jgi:hypothetical protein
MTVRDRTEITIETGRVLIIRGQRSAGERSKRVWCEKCGRDVDTVGFEEMKTLAGAWHPVLPAGAELGGWHVCANRDEAGHDQNEEPRVCLDSLLNSLQSAKREERRTKTLRGGVS